jgi:DNA-binding protein H-NS
MNDEEYGHWLKRYREERAAYDEELRLKREARRLEKEQRQAGREKMLEVMSDAINDLRGLMNRKKELCAKFEKERGELNHEMSTIVNILYKNGIQQKELAEELGVAPPTIFKMKNNDALP